MLKGHTFKSQLFENHIFATFVNTFMNKCDGVFSDYKNAMSITYTNNSMTVNSGLACIQGRLIEEDSSTTIENLDTDYVYCKLVIEIDLDKENTDIVFKQGEYKIIKGPSGYPNLTQTDIIKNNSGIYQYELARFRTSANGIVDFQDMRSYIDDEVLFLFKSNVLDTLTSAEQDCALSANQGKVLDEKKVDKAGGTLSGDFTFNGNVISNNLKNKNGSGVVYKENVFKIVDIGTITIPTGSGITLTLDLGSSLQSFVVVSMIVNGTYKYIPHTTASPGVVYIKPSDLGSQGSRISLKIVVIEGD